MKIKSAAWRGALGLLLLCAGGAGVAQQAQTPEALIRKLHANHQPWRPAPKAKVIDFHDKAVAAQYLDTELVELFQLNAKCRIQDKVPSCILPVDPVFHVQDFPGDSMTFDVKKQKAGPPEDAYAVDVRWSGQPDAVRYLYLLKKTPAGWRIADIQSSNYKMKEFMRTALRDMSYL